MYENAWYHFKYWNISRFRNLISCLKEQWLHDFRLTHTSFTKLLITKTLNGWAYLECLIYMFRRRTIKPKCHNLLNCSQVGNNSRQFHELLECTWYSLNFFAQSNYAKMNALQIRKRHVLFQVQVQKM